jgi:putative phosphoribosyl transferase
MSQSVPAGRVTRPVGVETASTTLHGDLAVPGHAAGFVVFAHASGSSRLSPRDRFVADTLDQHDLATLLIDLLSEDEEAHDDRTGRLRFDVGLLAGRLATIKAWTEAVPELQPLRVGLFGASTGSGAALLAAAQQPQAFHAVVSRGGRPDLAGSALTRVMAPTLLIVGELDTPMRALNQRAMTQIRCEVRLEVVRGAKHLFEEPGALEQVATLAAGWFRTHLAPPGSASDLVIE